MGLYKSAYYIGHFLFFMTLSMPFVLTASIFTKLSFTYFILFWEWFLFYFFNNLHNFTLAIILSTVFTSLPNVFNISILIQIVCYAYS